MDDNRNSANVFFHVFFAVIGPQVLITILLYLFLIVKCHIPMAVAKSKAGQRIDECESLDTFGQVEIGAVLFKRS